MTKSYYECHITMEGDPKEIEEKTRDAFWNEVPWKFSAIHGDILLGDGLKAYYTRHFNARKEPAGVLKALHGFADQLQAIGIKVTRRKVEMVLYDDRSTKVGSCEGGCIECHLDDLKPWHAEGGYT